MQLTLSALHFALVRGMLDKGYAPSFDDLVSEFQASPDEVRPALEALQAYHGVVLHPNRTDVWVVHPFSTAPTPFTVRRQNQLWWGNCAWCSLGIAALLGGDGIRIDTTLGGEGLPISVYIDEGKVRQQDLWVHFPIPMARAWDNVMYTCSTMLIFDSRQAIDSWSQRHNIPRGDVQPIQHIYDFAAVWYGRHADRDWRKWTANEAREIFTRFGLRGHIWDLPASAERF